MAILSLVADQLVEGYRRYPIDDHAKIRSQYGKVSAPAVAGDDGSYALFFKMPPARSRIWSHLSRIRWTAFGASRVLKLGHRAYRRTYDGGAALQPEDDDAFFSGLDIAAAGNVILPIPVTQLKFDMYATTEVEIYGTVTGGTWPTTGVIELMFGYGYE